MCLLHVQALLNFPYFWEHVDPKLDGHVVHHSEGLAVLLALRQLRKCCLDITTASNELQPVRVARRELRTQTRDPTAEHLNTLQAYFSVMHAVGAATEVYRGESVALQ